MNQKPKLADFRIAAPPVDRFLRPPSATRLQVRLREPGGSNDPTRKSAVPLPFFWYRPPWHLVHVERCRLTAAAAAAAGVTVSASAGDLAEDGSPGNDAAGPRMVPLRSDRAGWSFHDFSIADIIELRLGAARDNEGYGAYPCDQLSRWHNGKQENKAEGKGESAGGSSPTVEHWTPLMFPPEWPSLKAMPARIEQLRRLSGAAVLVSCDEQRLEEVLAAAARAGADGVLVRCENDPAAALIEARRQLDLLKAGRHFGLWLAAGDLRPEQIVKCLALGASAVAIDSLLNPLLLGEEPEVLTTAQRAALSFGVNVGLSAEERHGEQVNLRIRNLCYRVAGILQSLFVSDLAELGPEHLAEVAE